MSDDAFRVLGLEPGADARSVEAAYWQRARDVALRRDTDPGANAQLELLNNAYQFLAKDFVYGTRNMKPRQEPRGTRVRRYALIALLSATIAGGLVAGLGYRDEITDQAKAGYEQGEQSWNDTIDWLQDLNTTPTPEKPGNPQQPAQ